MMNLDEVQEMWQRDSVIDPDNLHDESLKIPQLHSKYYTIYNTTILLREKARETYNKVNVGINSFDVSGLTSGLYLVKLIILLFSAYEQTSFLQPFFGNEALHS
mgnify:CR=1 FL=1